MCCAVPGTKYLLDKVMVIIIIKKELLSSCSGDAPIGRWGLTVGGTMMTHGGCDSDSLPLCLDSLFLCCLTSRLFRTISFLMSFLLCLQGGRVVHSDGANPFELVHK